MSIDLDAIRNRLNSLQSKTKKQNNLWKPEPGKQTIRIVPYQFDKANPFREIYFHYDLGKRNYVSPITSGGTDPVCEFADQLKATGASDDWKMASKLYPKMRTYVPVIVRGKESEGVKLWGFGKTVYTELLGFISDPDYGDITDLQNGRDITVEFTAGSEGVFPSTTIRVKPAQTAATGDKAVAEAILNGQKNTDEVFAESTYDELKTALSEWLNPDGDGEAETPSATQAAAPVATPAGVTSTGDVDAAFDDLFNENK
jgi:hypothetical protein